MDAKTYYPDDIAKALCELAFGVSDPETMDYEIVCCEALCRIQRLTEYPHASDCFKKLWYVLEQITEVQGKYRTQRETRRRYCQKHREEINAARRERYHNDPEYRKKVLASIKKYNMKGKKK